MAMACCLYQAHRDEARDFLAKAICIGSPWSLKSPFWCHTKVKLEGAVPGTPDQALQAMPGMPRRLVHGSFHIALHKAVPIRVRWECGLYKLNATSTACTVATGRAWPAM